jgi:hypothetical protein
MKRKIFFLTVMLCMAFACANAQNGGNGNGGTPQIPIEITIKGKVNGTNGQGGTINLPVSASFTSDSLFIDVTEYSGVMVVAVVNTFTNQTVLQTLEHVSVTNNSVELDISTLSLSTYRVDIFLANNEGYEGYFEIE